MHWTVRRKALSLVLILCLLIEPVCTKRGGGGGFGRGSSGARSGGGFGRSRSGGGGLSGGGYKSSGGSSYPRGNYGTHNTGGGGGLWNRQQQSHGTSGGIFGGGSRGGTGTSGGFFGGSHSRPKFNKGSGLGSMVRSNTFKNAIVGAAAGYLTYQAGKHLIRSAMAPMMWNNRPYYWGSNYYQQRPGTSMCRMPIDQNDPQFGNIYFNDHTRPREIVWGCGYNEVCCGYECCPAAGGYGGGYGGGHGGGFFGGYNSAYRGFGFGSLLVLLLISCCACFLVYRMCNRTSGGYQRGRAEPPPYNAY